MLIPEPIPVAKEVGFTDWMNMCHGITCIAGVGDVSPR